MTVNAITDTKKGRTGIAPTYLHTTPQRLSWQNQHRAWARSCLRSCCQVLGTPFAQDHTCLMLLKLHLIVVTDVTWNTLHFQPEFCCRHHNQTDNLPIMYGFNTHRAPFPKHAPLEKADPLWKAFNFDTLLITIDLQSSSDIYNLTKQNWKKSKS